MSSNHLKRSCAPTPTRAIRIATQPSGVYVRVIEVRPDGREKTVEWLGKSPSMSRIEKAAKRWGATLPGGK